MEQKLSKEELEIDIGEIISILLSKLWFILCLGIIGALAMLIVSKFLIAPIYSSTTKVYVLNRQGAEGTNVTYSDLQLSSQITKDYVELITSRTVLAQVASELELDIGPGALKSMLSISTPGTDTRIISITVQDTDAYRAQKIADKVREVASVQICSVMNIEAVNIVDEADMPTSPSSPNVSRNTMLGGFFGVVAAIAIILLMYFMDDTIKSPDDIERYLELSVLGTIPIREDGKKEKKRRARIEMALEDEPVYREMQDSAEDDTYKGLAEDDYEEYDDDDDDYIYDSEDDY